MEYLQTCPEEEGQMCLCGLASKLMPFARTCPGPLENGGQVAQTWSLEPGPATPQPGEERTSFLTIEIYRPWSPTKKMLGVFSLWVRSSLLRSIIVTTTNREILSLPFLWHTPHNQSCLQNPFCSFICLFICLLFTDSTNTPQMCTASGTVLAPEDATWRRQTGSHTQLSSSSGFACGISLLSKSPDALTFFSWTP